MDEFEKTEKRGRSMTWIIPNMITTLALCSGLTAIRSAMDQNWEHAVVFVVAAGFLDAFDGAIARALNATSKLGAKLDSISDFVSFGVAPIILLYLWGLKGTGGFGWVVVLVFCICNALRLSRFHDAQSSLPEQVSDFWIGVPTPAGSALLMFPIIIHLQFPSFNADTLAMKIGVCVWAIIVGGLMISRLPTYSIRSMKITQSSGIFVLLSCGLFVGSLVNETWYTLQFLISLYIISLFVSYRHFKKLVNEHGTSDNEKSNASEKNN